MLHFIHKNVARVVSVKSDSPIAHTWILIKWLACRMAPRSQWREAAIMTSLSWWHYHHDIIFCLHQDGGFIKTIGKKKKKKDPTLPLIYTFFGFDFSKAIRNDIVLHILIRNVMKFGEKQLTMLSQTQYNVLSATLRVCVWMMSDFRILHWSFYPVN